MNHSFVILATRTDVFVCEYCGVQKDSPYWASASEDTRNKCDARLLEAATRPDNLKTSSASAGTSSTQPDLFSR